MREACPFFEASLGAFALLVSSGVVFPSTSRCLLVTDVDRFLAEVSFISLRMLEPFETTWLYDAMALEAAVEEDDVSSDVLVGVASESFRSQESAVEMLWAF